jgi:hypothetical protein
MEDDTFKIIKYITNRVNGWHKKVEKAVNTEKKAKKEGNNSLTDDQKELLNKKEEYSFRRAEAELILQNINDRFPHLFNKKEKVVTKEEENKDKNDKKPESNKESTKPESTVVTKEVTKIV